VPCGCGRSFQRFGGTYLRGVSVQIGEILCVSNIECAIYTQKLTELDTPTLIMEAACTSETSQTLPTFTRCDSPRTESTSIIKTSHVIL
jgi:hypothetical protein